MKPAGSTEREGTGGGDTDSSVDARSTSIRPDDERSQIGSQIGGESEVGSDVLCLTGIPQSRDLRPTLDSIMEADEEGLEEDLLSGGAGNNG